MRRLALCCGASVLLYALLFGLILDRPLSLGLPRTQIEAKLARGAAITEPKLVILAGSNGPYSHRCEVIEPIIARPCVNAGVAVGIGLDYLFARWQPLLRPGDVVYLPLEESQFTASAEAIRLGPDAAIMARHDWATLARLPPSRWLAALFAFDLRAGIMSLLETALVAGGFHDPRATAIGGSNAWGDHVGHTMALAAANRTVLARVVPVHARPDQVRHQAGGQTVGAFLDWARSHGVRAVGGAPTGFADSPIPPDTLAAIQSLFAAHGARFLTTDQGSRYPREAFFDTADHLHETQQVTHSRIIAAALRGLIDPGVMATAAAAPPPRP